jgi:hypothetical protein
MMMMMMMMTTSYLLPTYSHCTYVQGMHEQERG